MVVVVGVVGVDVKMTVEFAEVANYTIPTIFMIRNLGVK